FNIKPTYQYESDDKEINKDEINIGDHNQLSNMDSEKWFCELKKEYDQVSSATSGNMKFTTLFKDYVIKIYDRIHKEKSHFTIFGQDLDEQFIDIDIKTPHESARKPAPTNHFSIVDESLPSVTGSSPARIIPKGLTESPLEHITASSVIFQVIEEEPWISKEESRTIVNNAINASLNIYSDDTSM
ncbi:14410_t:CDS:2, partial [Entrophospora sp. SA101]